jgi:hypothetical protein
VPMPNAEKSEETLDWSGHRHFTLTEVSASGSHFSHLVLVLTPQASCGKWEV